MSTRKKESVSSVREKGGTSPSSTHLRSSPKPNSKTVSTSRSLDSSPSEKTIPNYLKPTLSSSLSSSLSAGDTTKLQGRRVVSNTDSALKSNLARRRSFDKPPSPTRSTKTRGVSPTPTFRSSSFSGKTGGGKATTTTTSPKGDRSLKGTRDAGKQPSLYARAVGTLKKSTSAIGKSNKAETGSSRKGPKHDNQDSSMGEEEAEEQQMVIHDASDGKEDEDSLVADQGEIDEDIHEQEQVEAESHKADSDAAKVESPTIIEQRDASIEKAETPTICEESDENDSKVESPPTILGQTDGDNEEADAAKVESPVKSEEGDPDSVKVDSPTVSEEQDASLGDKSCTEEISIEQQEMKEDTANEMDSSTNVPDQSVAAGNPNEEAGAEEEAKAEVGSGGEGHEGVGVEDEDVAPKVAHAHGKKDVALSNNVIEEMTREQRRNKVRALAGAFETVISLQDHK